MAKQLLVEHGWQTNKCLPCSWQQNGRSRVSQVEGGWRQIVTGQAGRLAVEAWGLKNYTQKEEYFSKILTTILVPPYIDSSEIVRRAWKRYNLSLGLGLNKVAGKVFRIGHLGNLNEVQLLGCLAGVEMILKDVGYPVKLGSGVAAASAYLQNNIPMIPSRI
ncbi:serine--glyoxylate aminotransferase-like [Macadamia integrifolia]|uniref:serine--glyoxylate aminotransferase-like n=1 Tax=Macadamia integrifolia TaxID=60698 RepID=UPI001C4F9B96|nr:serine--glyoxylate aminotransferase-like [Macadamia integrifolia]